MNYGVCISVVKKNAMATGVTDDLFRLRLDRSIHNRLLTTALVTRQTIFSPERIRNG